MADLALLTLTLFWGTTFTLVKQVLEISSPGVFLAARFGAAVLVLGLVALLRRERPGRRFLLHGSTLGLCLLATFVFQTKGLRYTTPSRSAFLTGMAVLLVPFVSRFLLGRTVRAASWAGVGLAVVGLFVLTRPFSDGVSAAVRLGDALTLGCALACAFQIALMSEWSPRHPLVSFTLLQVAVTFAGTLFLIPFEGIRFDASRAQTFAGVVAFTGLWMTAGAFFVQNWGQRHTTAVRAALIYTLEPVAAAVFSHFYGGESLSKADLLGGGLIVLGVIAGELGGVLERRAGPRPEKAEANRDREPRPEFPSRSTVP